jgi:hypothetical protein
LRKEGPLLAFVSERGPRALVREGERSAKKEKRKKEKRRTRKGKRRRAWGASQSET